MAQVIAENQERIHSDLQREINLLRSFIIGVAGKDEEGNYRPEFVRKILKSSREKKLFVFKNRNSFLSHLRKK